MNAVSPLFLACLLSPLALAEPRAPQASSTPGASLGPRASFVPARQVLVPAGSPWRYLDDGSNQGSAWRAPAFDDTGWAEGPAQLGYGDGDEQTVVSFGSNPSQKHVTTYYRRRFQVADPTRLAGLELRLLRDDGAVCYLNGVEVLRTNMTTGSFSFATLASISVGGIEEDRFRVHHPPLGPLVAGENVLAVEIHQGALNSSDTSFDLALEGLVAPELARGPYLQLATPDAISVRWRTTSPTDSRLRWGSDPSVSEGLLESAAPTTEHELRISGLQPATTYYYSVEDGAGVLSGGPDHVFTTQPRRGGRAATRIWVLGDAGTALPAQEAVRDAYEAFAGARRADLVLLLGDNAYQRGTDEEYQLALFDLYAAELRRAPFWPARGNHEDFATVYTDMFTLPAAAQAGGVPSGSELYYSFDHANVHFVCLDSDSQSRAVGAPMWTWLQSDLQATRADWIIAYWHHPPYSKGSHDSDLELQLFEMRQNFLPLLESHGVDLVLGGHSHSYERSFLIDGHYGNSLSFSAAYLVDGGDGRPLASGGDGAYRKRAGAHHGAVYCVAGSSGQITNAILNHPAMFHSVPVLGSLVLDVEGARLDATFVDDNGQVEDWFTLEKPAVGGPSVRLEPISVAAGGRRTLVLDGGIERAGQPFELRLGGAGPAAALIASWAPSGGVLDEVGLAEVELRVPADAPRELAGRLLEHQLLVLDAAREALVPFGPTLRTPLVE